MKKQITELVTVSRTTQEVTLSPELADTLQKISESSNNKINGIECSLQQLSEKVSNLQGNITTSDSTASAAGRYPQSDTAMQPNTVSPHLQNNEVKAPCEPFMDYKKCVITDNIKSALLNLVVNNSSNFKSVGEDKSRDVLYYGEYAYHYIGAKHEPEEMPEPVCNLLETIRQNLPDDNRDTPINSCLVSRYNSGKNHIPPHRDNEPVIDPESLILTVSLGEERTMIFTNNAGTQIQKQILEDSSLLITTRYAQDFWKHEISEDESEGPRYSFTFRHIAPHFINSTIVLGDSNTHRLNFGKGQGTLGAWLPGKQVKAGHIEGIPDPKNIGPFRNIVIHTGINSINNSKYRKSNRYLINVLESKCRNISEVYPRAKIYVSLLLPTRFRTLNYQVREFNELILEMTYSLRNVYVIDNSLFGDVLCDEHGRWDTVNQRPNTADALHLGKKGMRILAKNIKSTIMGNGRNQNRSRFNGSGGQYGAAATRGEHYDGYQGPI